MLEAAERGRGRYVAHRRPGGAALRAGRASSGGGDLPRLAAWRRTGTGARRIFVAVSVLIITCPCALGLAVPVVHVAAAGRLLARGHHDEGRLGAGAAGRASTGWSFDKTGTLTTGAPRVSGGGLTPRTIAPPPWRLPAIRRTRGARDGGALEGPAAALAELREVPGHGIEGSVDGRLARLGRSGWVAAIASGAGGRARVRPSRSRTGPLSAFALSETLRPGAREAVSALAAGGARRSRSSPGDGAGPVGAIAARSSGIARVRATRQASGEGRASGKRCRRPAAAS